jgi:hypothetical protein
MPFYTYKSTLSGETIDVFQGMNDKHEYRGENGEEDFWVRVYHKPLVVIDPVSSSIDPHSSRDFVEKTRGKNGTIGDLLDLSAELSEKRGGASGKDPVKRKYFDDYKERTGKSHVRDKPSKIEKNGVTIDFSD